MDVSIIILNYKGKNIIKQLIKGVKAQRVALTYEIIVVDNDSQDGIGEMIKENYPDVKFLANKKNYGYASGCNLGIAHAQGKYILTLNPDIVVVNDAIQKLYEFMEANPTVGVAGPKLMYPNGEIQDSAARWPNIWMPLYRRTFLQNTERGKIWISNFFYKEWDHNSNKEVDWLHGACLMVRKDALIKVGLLDEMFFLYLEDTDWCRRFWEAGYKVVYVANAVMYHFHTRSSVESNIFKLLFNKPSREHMKSFVKYMLKYRGKPNPHLI